MLSPDAAAAAIKVVLDGVDAYKLWKKKSDIELALSLVSADAAMWVSKVESLSKKEADAKEKMDEAYEIWLEASKPLTYKLHCPRTCLEGEVISAMFKMNKVYEWVKWYVDYELSETDIRHGNPTEAFFDFTGPPVSVSTDYWITAQAQVVGSGEVVSASQFVTVLPEGVFLDKTVYNTYDIINVTIRKKRLSKARMYIGNELVDSGTSGLGSGNTIYLSKRLSSEYSGLYIPVKIEYEYFVNDYDTNTTTESHTQYISVN